MDIVITSCALSLILTQPQITGAKAGFILAFGSSISSNVQWILARLRSFELKGISLERTAEYRMLEKEEGQSLNPENPKCDGDEGIAVSASLQGWPSQGAIEISNIWARYGSDLPDILQDISFSVEGGQRVGIVGATGGGKSTLAKAFFSFVDITNGKIEIDGKGKLFPPL